MSRVDSATYGAVFIPVLSDMQFMVECQNCKARFMLKRCAMCGGSSFSSGYGGTWGISCANRNCGMGFSTWLCSKCGTNNVASHTLYVLEKEGGCFIATAVYGDENAREVVLLRTFRDNILLRSRIGRYLVSVYYLISPPLARSIKSNVALRCLVRRVVLQPILGLICSKPKRNQKKE